MTTRKDDILAFLKARDQATLGEIAEALGLTKQGALRHLDGLQHLGLVEHQAAAHAGPGRPEHVYRLGDAASERFLNGHRELAGELVSFIDREDLRRFFEDRAARLEQEYAARLEGLNLEDRVRELARLATDHGHMAEVVGIEDGALGIRHHNCPIADVAGATGHPCQAELAMYGRLLGLEVDRTSWIAESAPNCTYVIKKLKVQSV